MAEDAHEAHYDEDEDAQDDESGHKKVDRTDFADKSLDESGVELNKPSKNAESAKKKIVILSYDKYTRNTNIFKLLIFFVVSLVYFYLIFFTGFETVGDLILEEPIAVNWASRRRQLTRAVNLWVSEVLFENSTKVGYH